MIRKYFDKISKILVVIGMILSMCFSAGNISENVLKSLSNGQLICVNITGSGLIA